MKSKPRIALFLQFMAMGGAEKMMLNLAGGFLARGYAVDLVLAQTRGPLLEQVSPEVRVVDLKSARVLSALPKLVNYFRSARPDVVLSALTHANLIAVWAKLLSGSRTHVVVSKDFYFSQKARVAVTRTERLFPFLMRLTYRAADGIIAASSGAADALSQLIAIPRQSIAVIYNPVLVGNRIEEMAEAPLDHPWFQTELPPVFLSVGRMEIAKDYPTLLQAFALLKERVPARLIILGDGSLRPQLEALAEELGLDGLLEMPGFTNNPFQFMRRSKAVVMSSRWETFGNVLVEAMACGTQAISTNCPSGPMEILENGEYGWLVPMSDPQALALAMEDALHNPRPMEKLRAHARKFSVNLVTEQYLRVLFPEGDSQA
jgi:glycosyltransferase involved in cell wall biosynthesis